MITPFKLTFISEVILPSHPDKEIIINMLIAEVKSDTLDTEEILEKFSKSGEFSEGLIELMRLVLSAPSKDSIEATAFDFVQKGIISSDDLIKIWMGRTDDVDEISKAASAAIGRSSVPLSFTEQRMGERQNGYDCGFIALGVTREEVLKYARDNIHNAEFRKLLLPEIRSLGVLECANHIVSSMDTEDREKRLKELYEICDALTGTPEFRIAYSEMTKLVGSIDLVGSKKLPPDESPIILTDLLKDQVLELFSKYADAHDLIQPLLNECNDSLGFGDGSRKNFDELTIHFEEHPEANEEAKALYDQARGIVMIAKANLDSILLREDTTRHYLEEYYNSRKGWLAFQPNQSGGENSSLIDIIARYKKCQIIVWQNEAVMDPPRIIYNTCDYSEAGVIMQIHMRYNGRNHFTSLVSDDNTRIVDVSVANRAAVSAVISRSVESRKKSKPPVSASEGAAKSSKPLSAKNKKKQVLGSLGTNDPDEALIIKSAEIINNIISKTDWDEGCISAFQELGECFRLLSWDQYNKALIRNKYGYYDRADSKTLRAQGIDFETFCKLEQIFGDTKISELFKVNLSQIQTDLKQLSKKLEDIKARKDIDATEENKFKSLFEKLTKLAVDFNTIKIITEECKRLKAVINEGKDLSEEALKKAYSYSLLFEFAKIGESCKILYDSPGVKSVCTKSDYDKIIQLKKFRDDIKQIVERPWRKDKVTEVNEYIAQCICSIDDIEKIFLEMHPLLASKVGLFAEPFDLALFVKCVNSAYYFTNFVSGTQAHHLSKHLRVQKPAKSIDIDLDFAKSLVSLIKEYQDQSSDPSRVDKVLKWKKANYESLRKKYLNRYPATTNVLSADEVLTFGDEEITTLLAFHQQIIDKKEVGRIIVPQGEGKQKSEEEMRAEQMHLLEHILESVQHEIEFQKALVSLEPSLIVERAIATSLAIIGSEMSLLNPKRNLYALQDFATLCIQGSEWFSCLEEIEQVRNKAIMHEEKGVVVSAMLNHSSEKAIPFEDSIRAMRAIRFFENICLKKYGDRIFEMPPVITDEREALSLLKPYLYRIGLAYAVLGQYDKAIEVFQELQNKTSESLEGFLSLQILRNLSAFYYSKGDIGNAILHRKRLIDTILKQPHAVPNQRIADELFQLAQFYTTHGNNSEAATCLAQAEEYCIDKLEFQRLKIEVHNLDYTREDRALFQNLLDSLATIKNTGALVARMNFLSGHIKGYMQSGDHEFSKEIFRDVKRVLIERKGEIRKLLQNRAVALYARIDNAEADLYYFRGDYTTALALNLSALRQLDREKYKTPHRFNVLKAIASCYVQLKQFDRAGNTIDVLMEELESLGANKYESQEYWNILILRIQSILHQIDNPRVKTTRHMLEEALLLSQESYTVARKFDRGQVNKNIEESLTLQTDILLRLSRFEEAYDSFYSLSCIYDAGKKFELSSQLKFADFCTKLSSHFSEQLRAKSSISTLLKLENIIKFYIKHILDDTAKPNEVFSTYFALAKVYQDEQKYELAAQHFATVLSLINSDGIDNCRKIEFYSKYASVLDKILDESPTHPMRDPLSKQIIGLSRSSLTMIQEAISESQAKKSVQREDVLFVFSDIQEAQSMLTKYSKEKAQGIRGGFALRETAPKDSTATSFRLKEIEQKIKKQFQQLKGSVRLDLDSVSKEDLDLFCTERMPGIDVRTLKRPIRGSAILLSKEVIDYLKGLFASREPSAALRK